jgi:inorganic pyrophosphatase/exopolyphosphatase
MREPAVRLHVTVPRVCPDLDGVACAVAFAELLRSQSIAARAWIAGTPDPEASFAARELGVTLDAAPPPEGCAFILVDASDLRGMPPSLDPLRVIEVIDHRLHHRAPELFPHAVIVIEPVGAAATLVTERYQSLGVLPSPIAARLLQAAILSNTQALRGTITTERDRAAHRALAALSPLDRAFVEGQFEARRRAVLQGTWRATVSSTPKGSAPSPKTTARSRGRT